ncbi:DUF3313 domain-containing protein [Aeromonas fluvialis]|uniref:DUF3313 domain-containing protein n=1 Tax=Aeromonas fluvialis TaxID=591962 RepID=UPI000693F5F0|nr:DUF3313 domain-containing protein [Aeromonas fluvialis]
MKIKKVAILLSALMLSACAGSGGKSSADIPRSGYLGDYSAMTQIPGDTKGEALRWLSPSLVKGKYKKAIIYPVTYYPKPQEGAQVKQENLDKISANLTQQLSQEIGKSFELTNTPGSDTLAFKVAITGVATNLEGLQFYEVVPVALVLAGASTALGYRDKVITISAEGLVTDSMTNEVMAKALRQGVAENLDNDKQQVQVDKVDGLFKEWATLAGKLAADLR